MTLQDLDTLLKIVTPEVYELAAPEGAASFVVYARTGWLGIRADDAIAMSIPRVQIDIVTQSASSDLESQIFDMLRTVHIPYSVIDTGYNFERNWYVTRLSVVLPDG